MQVKFWPDHQAARHIEVGGVCWLLDHLRGTSFQIDIPSAAGQPRVLLTVNVEFSSHCVSRGPKEGDHIDFHLVGVERMVIDHRRIKREFKEDRHALSFLLPEIVRTFKDRRCFFHR